MIFYDVINVLDMAIQQNTKIQYCMKCGDQNHSTQDCKTEIENVVCPNCNGIN